MKKMLISIAKVIIILIIWLLALILTIAIIKGKGKPVTLLDESGKKYVDGISTKETVTIGNSKQTIFIVGEKKDNTVLLFLHGGPGSPEVAMHSFEAGNRLEEKFTVVYWEQRGSGLSYNARLSPEEMTLDLMINDTIELTEYLTERFGQDKIYLMGHSWGTFLGTKVISRKPEYYKAYLGIGQVSDQRQSEVDAYNYMLEHAKEIDDQKAIISLSKFDPANESFPSTKYMGTARTNYMNKYGVGIKHKMDFRMSEIIKEVFDFEGYSLSGFVKFAMGSLYSQNTLFDFVLQEDLKKTTTDFEVPVYIFHGIYDKQVSYELSKKYFNSINAPDKEFFSFEHSAHSPNFEETNKFLQIVFSIYDKIEKI